MKQHWILGIGIFLLLLLTTSCANGKKVQETGDLVIESAYYTAWTGGVKGADSGYTLFLPAKLNSDIKLDSVYFRGRKAAIEKSGAAPDLYVAYFKIPSDEGEAPDIIMHADPRREYGNKPPRIPEKIPFELQEGEAVVRYLHNGKENYLRVTGIKKEDGGEVKIKSPENIRH